MALVYPYLAKHPLSASQWEALHSLDYREGCLCGFDFADPDTLIRVGAVRCPVHQALQQEPVFPPVGNVRPAPVASVNETLARIKRRDAEAALRSRLMDALTGLENAPVEARVAIKKWNEFESSVLATPAAAVQNSHSEEFGSSPNTFSSDSRVSPATEPTGGADIGSQEGGVASVSSPSKSETSLCWCDDAIAKISERCPVHGNHGRVGFR